MEELTALTQQIYKDTLKENSTHYKNYESKLHQLHQQFQTDLKPQVQSKFALAYYNLAKLSNRPRYLKNALEFMPMSVVYVQWALQKIALTSARDNHAEAYQEAVSLIEVIMSEVELLDLPNSLKIFAKEVRQILSREAKKTFLTTTSPSQLETNRKFQTECPLVTHKFHLADIMAMEPIDPKNNKKLDEQMPKSNQEALFYYLVFLSIACFTRATQKFYCRETSERDYHLKAIEIAGYFYPKKSVFIRFLKRTYSEHYKEALLEITEEDEEHGDLKFRVQPDPEEVSMGTMPWDNEEFQVSVKQAEEQMNAQTPIKEQLQDKYNKKAEEEQQNGQKIEFEQRKGQQKQTELHLKQKNLFQNTISEKNNENTIVKDSQADEKLEQQQNEGKQIEAQQEEQLKQKVIENNAQQIIHNQKQNEEDQLSKYLNASPEKKQGGHRKLEQQIISHEIMEDDEQDMVFQKLVRKQFVTEQDGEKIQDLLASRNSQLQGTVQNNSLTENKQQEQVYQREAHASSLEGSEPVVGDIEDEDVRFQE